MRRGRKIAIGAAIALIVVLALLGLNALLLDGETKGAAITEPGGRILDLPDGRMQVVEKGPRQGSPNRQTDR